MTGMQFGIFTIGDVTEAPTTGKTATEHERISATVAIAQKAEEVGLDVFATGEHHNPPFVPSSPTTLLGYLAGRTERLILSTSTNLHWYPAGVVEPRIRAAVLFAGSFVPRVILAEAQQVTIPLHVVLQWDDKENDSQMALDLFYAFGSKEKILHANMGGHTGVPQFAGEEGNCFLARHLK